MASGNRFVVDLGTLKLKDDEQRSVAAAIQGAVLTHLAAKFSLQGKTIKMDDGIGVAGLFVDPSNSRPGPKK